MLKGPGEDKAKVKSRDSGTPDWLQRKGIDGLFLEVRETSGQAVIGRFRVKVVDGRLTPLAHSAP